jgi:hypothetical protein
MGNCGDKEKGRVTNEGLLVEKNGLRMNDYMLSALDDM